MKLNKFRKWSRILHRDLSFFFSGMFIIYAVSGIALNHRNTYNSNFSVEVSKYVITDSIPSEKNITKQYVIDNLLEQIDEKENYTKHYFPKPNTMKVFLKGGSSLVVDITTQEAVYESLEPRHVMSAMSKLHYNPGSWWTTFSDIFAVGVLVIILSGLVMIKGRKGIVGIGGLELLAGMLIPIAFLLFS